MRLRPVLAAVLLILGAAPMWGQTTRSEPSTPEERTRALQATKKLEQQPLGAQAGQERGWLTKWIIEIPDISVPVCDELLKPLLQGEVGQYRYSKELVAQEMAGAMAFLIEHPQPGSAEDQDDFAINKAGMDSMLNAYDAIVRSAAKGARWGPLEELQNKRKAGQLDDYVRQATLKCATGDTLSAGVRFPGICSASWKGRMPAPARIER